MTISLHAMLMSAARREALCDLLSICDCLKPIPPAVCSVQADLLTLCKSESLHKCGAAGLLASGIIPSVQHCLNNLLTTDARVIPASATVYAQVRMQSRGLCSVSNTSAMSLPHL